MDYAATLMAAEAALGTDSKIVVRRYDRAAFEGGDIYHDFCVAAGIAWDDAYEIPEKEVNFSLSFDVAEALRVFADKAPADTSPRTGILAPLARKLSRRNPDAPGTTPFCEEEARAFMESFSAGNRWISDNYFGGDPLFSDEYGGRPVWVPNEERIAECRAAFEKALRNPTSEDREPGKLWAITRKLPEGIKRPLRAIRKGLRL